MDTVAVVSVSSATAMERKPSSPRQSMARASATTCAAQPSRRRSELDESLAPTAIKASIARATPAQNRRGAQKTTRSGGFVGVADNAHEPPRPSAYCERRAPESRPQMNRDKNDVLSGFVVLRFLPEAPEANSRPIEGEHHSRLKFNRDIALP
jgi:hypothetical protein